MKKTLWTLAWISLCTLTKSIYHVSILYMAVEKRSFRTATTEPFDRLRALSEVETVWPSKHKVN